MSYKDAYHPKTKTDLKKLDKPVLKELFDTHINNIINDPYYILMIGKRENFYDILRRRLS